MFEKIGNHWPTAKLTETKAFQLTREIKPLTSLLTICNEFGTILSTMVGDRNKPKGSFCPEYSNREVQTHRPA